MNNHNHYLRLSPVSFGIAFGSMWSLGMLLLGWMGWLWQYGSSWVKAFGNVYFGYAPTFLGGIIGAIWGFIDFFIFAWLVALIYNVCVRVCHRTTQEDN